MDDQAVADLAEVRAKNRKFIALAGLFELIQKRVFKSDGNVRAAIFERLQNLALAADSKIARGIKMLQVGIIDRPVFKGGNLPVFFCIFQRAGFGDGAELERGKRLRRPTEAFLPLRMREAAFRA